MPEEGVWTHMEDAARERCRFGGVVHSKLCQQEVPKGEEGDLGRARRGADNVQGTHCGLCHLSMSEQQLAVWYIAALRVCGGLSLQQSVHACIARIHLVHVTRGRGLRPHTSG